MAGNKRPTKKRNLNHRKVKTNTPVLFRYGKDDDNKLKFPPQISLEEFNSGLGDLSKWKTIYFRVQVGTQLINYFEKDSLDIRIEDGIDCLNDIYYHHQKTNKWEINSNQLSLMKSILCCIDNMQDGTTRNQQLIATNYVLANITKPGQENKNAKTVW